MAEKLLKTPHVQHAGEGDHSDGGGLMLRIRRARLSSKKGLPMPATEAWVFRYTAPSGRRREMGLGPVRRANAKEAGESLTGARAAAAKARELLQQGVDPIDARKQRRAAAQQAEENNKAEKERERWTLARAAREYHERVIEPTRTTKHSAQWIASLEHHVPAVIWNKPIAEVDAPELLQAMQGVRSLEDKDQRIPETLQRVRQRLDAVFEDAIFHKRCTSNPAAAIRRKMREAMPRKQAGQFAALPYREAPAFMARLREAEGIAARCLELAVLTAARTSEVLFASWSEFDLDQALWVVPAERMKAGEEHTVHLTARAVEIVRGLQELKLHRQWVFPSPMLPDKPLSNMAMLTVLDRMKMRDRTTVHGLCRATFSTWANETGAARPDVIEACLAHEESNRVRAAYNRAQFTEERRALMKAWAAYLSTPSNVVALKAA
jgi:integrase